MALDMVDALTDLRDPSTGGSMKIRIGKITLHTKSPVITFRKHFPVLSSFMTYHRVCN